MEIWKKELKEIESNLETIRKQYERTEETVVEVVDNFQCHKERINKLSTWQKQFFDIEILKMVNIVNEEI